ncbi:hypothetical protein FACS1894110_04510 [Spirochaetia bacterium]|nr:hypothetical protein FACS1894110_04510 [Spirochaetia bacterium]
MKKVFLAAVICIAMGVSAVSAVEVGLGGGGGFNLPLPGGYGDVYAYALFPIKDFDIGVNFGYQSKLDSMLFAGASGQYNFKFAGVPGLALYPKVGIDFGFIITFGVDITAGGGVSYNFKDLIGFGLVVRGEVLFDLHMGFPLLIGVGPKFQGTIGFAF